MNDLWEVAVSHGHRSSAAACVDATAAASVHVARAVPIESSSGTTIPMTRFMTFSCWDNFGDGAGTGALRGDDVEVRRAWAKPSSDLHGASAADESVRAVNAAKTIPDGGVPESAGLATRAAAPRGIRRHAGRYAPASAVSPPPSSASIDRGHRTMPPPADEGLAPPLLEVTRASSARAELLGDVRDEARDRSRRALNTTKRTGCLRAEPPRTRDSLVGEDTFHEP
jgi:hypothetical protein